MSAKAIFAWVVKVILCLGAAFCAGLYTPYFVECVILPRPGFGPRDLLIWLGLASAVWAGTFCWITLSCSPRVRFHIFNFHGGLCFFSSFYVCRKIYFELWEMGTRGSSLNLSLQPMDLFIQALFVTVLIPIGLLLLMGALLIDCSEQARRRHLRFIERLSRNHPDH